MGKQQDTHVRLLRPFLPDGTPINTPFEDKQLRIQEQELRLQEQEHRKAAEAKAAEEVERRRELETELEELRNQLAHAEAENT